MVQITVVKLYLAFFCKFAIMLRCISRQITQIGVHISWKIISRPVVISALFLCCHSVIPVDGLLSNGCQWRCVQWTSLVPSFPFFTRWHIPPSPFPFFMKWHIPPSRTSAEASLTGWPNAWPQGWDKYSVARHHQACLMVFVKCRCWATSLFEREVCIRAKGGNWKGLVPRYLTCSAL